MENKAMEYTHTEHGSKIAALLHPSVDIVRVRFSRAAGMVKKTKEQRWVDHNITFVRSSTAVHFVKGLLELHKAATTLPEGSERQPAEVHLVKTFKDGTGLMLWWNRFTGNVVWEERGGNFTPIGFNVGQEAMYCNGVIKLDEVHRVCGVISHLAQAHAAEVQLQKVQDSLRT